LKVTIRMRPHARFAIIAVLNSRNMIGIRNVSATRSFARKVERVASQTSEWEFFSEDSCEMWMLRASENASAIAIVRIPPMTANLREVAAFKPIITARVVMTPEVRPNAKPVFIEGFIEY